MSVKKSSKIVETLAPNIWRVALLPGGQKAIPPTFAVRNSAKFQRPKAKTSRGWSVYTNDLLTIRVRDDGKPFNAENLQVEWKCDGEARAWKPGEKDRENLGGSYLSLDMMSEHLVGEKIGAYDPLKGLGAQMATPAMLCDTVRDAVRVAIKDLVDDEKWFPEFRRLLNNEAPGILKEWPRDVLAMRDRVRTIPPGLLSRSGLTIFLDDTLPWDDKANWIGTRGKHDPTVVYIVHYGRDFKAGIAGLTKLLGVPPQAPEWVLGVWFSCYQMMGEQEYRKLHRDFCRHDLPLDTVVVDTDWHQVFWHGFDWNNTLFPKPKRFTRWLRSLNLHAAYNVHPQYIPDADSRLPEFLEKTGVEKHILTQETAPNRFHVDCHRVDLFDPAQSRAYFDVFHKPIEEDGGCDMWWIDGTLKDNTGRDATAWLNELYIHRARPPKNMANPRGELVLSRTHGLGAHRSTLHFTGDTFSQWKLLEAEVCLTPMAANVLLAYVSHDIGGFFKGYESMKRNKPSPELMTRWVQFGVFSPIFRLHSDHGVREPWKFGMKALKAMRRFLQLRREMLPYLSALAKEAHRSGVGLCRPMYYEFPDDEMAYRLPFQYMFGQDVLVAPVSNEAGRVYTWFPPGAWRHVLDNRVVTGPCSIEETCDLDTIPVYTRADRPVPWK